MEGTMVTTLYFCLACQEDNLWGKFCAECGGELIAQDVVIYVEAGKVTKVLLK